NTGLDCATAFDHPDLSHEVRDTLARAKAEILGGGALEDIAIVCRDMQTYARRIIATAREFDLPVQIDYEMPLAETELGRFISLVFEVVDRRSTEEIATGTGRSRRVYQCDPTIRRMLHRLGPGLSDQQRTRAYEKLPSNYDAWRSITDDAELVYAQGERSPSEWTSWLRNLLGRWEIRSKEKLGAIAEEIQAYDRFFRSLEQSAHELGPAEIHISQFASEVADILANGSTPLHTTNAGVRILEPNDMPGRSFDTIFVIGMAEGSLPAVSADSNVIDFHECERLRKHNVHFQDALEVPRWE